MTGWQLQNHVPYLAYSTQTQAFKIKFYHQYSNYFNISHSGHPFTSLELNIDVIKHTNHTDHKKNIIIYHSVWNKSNYCCPVLYNRHKINN